MRIFYVYCKGTTGVGGSSHRGGSIGVIEREVSALKLFQTPRPASPIVIFQNAKVLRSEYNLPLRGLILFGK